MNRKLFLTLVLLIPLSFIATSAYTNSTNEVNPGDTAFYYNERGKLIWKEYNAKEKMSFVIKTKRTSGHIYGDAAEHSPDYRPADVNSISPKVYRKVENLIKRGRVHHSLVTNNVVRILNKETFLQIRNNIQDDGKGTVNSSNNKEYGGFITNDGNITDTTSGSIVDPCALNGAHIVLNGVGKCEYHSHPSGSRKLEAERDVTEMVTMTGSRTKFGERTETFHFIQGPSKVDQNSIRKDSWGYVFGMEEKRIYVYNNKGVFATLSFRAFER